MGAGGANDGRLARQERAPRSVRFSAAERALIVGAAERAGLAFGVFVRQAALLTARRDLREDAP